MMKFATRAALVAAIVTAGATGAWAQVPGTEAIVGISTTTTATDTAKVTALDLPSRTVTLTYPNGGRIRPVNVTQAAAQKDLSRVKPGDKLTVVDTQILFVGIEKRG